MRVTKVGPPEPSDHPRKKGFVNGVLKFLTYMASLAWLGRVFLILPFGRSAQIRDVINEEDEGFHYVRPAGIPEADLTSEQRKEALEQVRWREKD